jgi:putative ABC transport system substrate-binding protein
MTAKMQRRDFITLLGGAATWPLDAGAQQAGKIPRVGFMGNSTAALEANLIGPFRQGLREHGYEEGRNIETVFRWAEGKYERFPVLIAELVSAKVDMIVTAGTPASLAVKNANTSIPLIMIAVSEPVATGLVASFARPGGNITGLTSMAPEIDGKRLELLRELVPNISYIAVLWNAGSPIQVIQEKEMRAAADVIGMKMLLLGVRSLEEIEKAFTTIIKEQPGALFVLADRLFLHHRKLIMDFATQHRLPGVHAYRELVEAGGLMSYGPSYAAIHKRAAYFVDRILKGASPGDLPIEQPTIFELILNLKTAKALGLAVPPTLLARADEVIE